MNPTDQSLRPAEAGGRKRIGSLQSLQSLQFDGGITSSLPSAAELKPKPNGVERFGIVHLNSVCMSIHDTLDQVLKICRTEIHVVTSDIGSAGNEGNRRDNSSWWKRQLTLLTGLVGGRFYAANTFLYVNL